MGWFWGPSDDDQSRGTTQDPLRNLDPGLREFLAKESPVKYNASNPSQSPAQEEAPPLSSPPRTTGDQPSSDTSADSKPKVPSESLFKDGRYAHLWTNYRPQTEIENEVKSDAEKIQDVLEGYKYRKAEIGRAALENCALEQWDVNECFRHGGVKQRLTMCRAENRKFERCYMMQAKFLKALGYMSTFDRTPDVDERIQMHADTLFHKMLSQETAIAAAAAAGEPEPAFPPLLSSSSSLSQPSSNANSDSTTKSRYAPVAPQEEGTLKPADMKESVQQKFAKRLEGLSGEERELEERAIKAEIKAGEEVAGSLSGIYERQAEERARRREQGRETLSDKLTSVFRGR